MKISIIGASGFIGKYLSKNMPKKFKIKKISLRNEDLSDLKKKTIKYIFSSKVIINCAASLYPKTSNDFFLNQNFLKYLLNINKRYKKKIIHLSSINTLITDRIDQYSLTKKYSESGIKNNKNLTIIRLPLVIERKKGILLPKGNVSKLFSYLKKVRLPIYPMIYPGHIYQPIEIGILRNRIIKIIKKNKNTNTINLVGDKKISLYNLFEEISDLRKKKIIKIDLRCLYRFLPFFIKNFIKKQNNFIQQISSIDHSRFK